jgi:hypothetical protein
MTTSMASPRALFRSASFRPITAAALALALLSSAPLISASPARAGDPVFPTGSRLGLVPPSGMVASRNFVGFEDPEHHAAILLTTLPAPAYGEIDKSMSPENMKKDGIDVDRRDAIELGFGKGFVLSGRQTVNGAHLHKWLMAAPAKDFTALVTVETPADDKTYSDAAIRDALATLAQRDKVPDSERLSLLPFQIGDLAGFQVDDVLPGRAIVLVERADQATAGNAKSDASQSESIPLNARLFIAALPGVPDAKDRDNFARVAFQQIAGITDIHLLDAEPLRISNLPGYETLATAKESRGDTPVKVVQWLRFGSSGMLQIVGIARADVWNDAFTRMRTLRDSIEAK